MNSLDAPFSEEEMKDVAFYSSSDGAPGLDGLSFTVCFSKEYGMS